MEETNQAQMPPLQFQVGTHPQMPGAVLLAVMTPFGVQTFPMSNDIAKQVADGLRQAASGIITAPANALRS